MSDSYDKRIELFPCETEREEQFYDLGYCDGLRTMRAQCDERIKDLQSIPTDGVPGANLGFHAAVSAVTLIRNIADKLIADKAVKE